MNTRTKIYIAIAAASILLITITGGTMWSNHKIARLERAVESAKADAAKSQTAADEMEKQSAAYAAKTAYLEQKLAEQQALARRQDEELEKLNTDTNRARANVERARRPQPINTTTADQLCAKLAELGHGCN